MNGNQGLEALATLCNNASMSNEEINVPNNERNRQHNQRVATNSPSTTSSSSSGLHLSGANVTSTAHQMSNFPPHVANVLKSMGPNLTAAQMGSLMANFGMLTSGIPPSNDQSSSLHQLAYANANNAPYMHPGMIPFMTQSNQNTSGGFPFAGVDPNTMNALIHASHMQNGKKDRIDMKQLHKNKKQMMQLNVISDNMTKCKQRPRLRHQISFRCHLAMTWIISSSHMTFLSLPSS
jgi:hypothetical protein